MTTKTPDFNDSLAIVRRELLVESPDATDIRETLFGDPAPAAQPATDFDGQLLQALHCLKLLEWVDGGCVIATRRINLIKVSGGKRAYIVTDFPPTRKNRRDGQFR